MSAASREPDQGLIDLLRPTARVAVKLEKEPCADPYDDWQRPVSTRKRSRSPPQELPMVEGGEEMELDYRELFGYSGEEEEKAGLDDGLDQIDPPVFYKRLVAEESRDRTRHAKRRRCECVFDEGRAEFEAMVNKVATMVASAKKTHLKMLINKLIGHAAAIRERQRVHERSQHAFARLLAVHTRKMYDINALEDEGEPMATTNNIPTDPLAHKPPRKN